MQIPWSLKIDWTDELPPETATEWHLFNSVSSICISKCIVHPLATRVELHGFADASEKCYGAVIYRRSQSPDDATKRRKMERTFRCPEDQPSGDHLTQDIATTGVQKGYKEFERKL
ncbi:hypothetical protein TNCV_1050861 [Trichonephila clavipes]|nr:hypothetical protein TNCV_1050861 [Trichonephila clavipes]